MFWQSSHAYFGICPEHLIVFYFKILKRQRYYRSVLAFIIIYLQAKQPKIALALSFLQETYFYSVCAETLKKLHKTQNKLIFLYIYILNLMLGIHQIGSMKLLFC